MVPSDFVNYFLASAGAGGTLVGLLFVAVSIAPEHTVMAGAPRERRAVAGSSFTALLNAFFISLGALLPTANLGIITMVMCFSGLLSSLNLGWNLLKPPLTPRNILRSVFMVLIALVLYGFELYYALRLLLSPSDVNAVFDLSTLLIGVYALGLIRAWELLGARRYGLTSWLNPLYEVRETVNTDSSDSAEAVQTKRQTPQH